MYEMQFNKSMFSCGGEKTDKKNSSVHRNTCFSTIVLKSGFKLSTQRFACTFPKQTNKQTYYPLFLFHRQEGCRSGDGNCKLTAKCPAPITSVVFPYFCVIVFICMVTNKLLSQNIKKSKEKT